MIQFFLYGCSYNGSQVDRKNEKTGLPNTTNNDNGEAPDFDDLPPLEPIAKDDGDNESNSDLLDLEDFAEIIDEGDEGEEGIGEKDEEEIVNVFETLTEEEQECWKEEVKPL